jgi:hypothetical protein
VVLTDKVADSGWSIGDNVTTRTTRNKLSR